MLRASVAKLNDAGVTLRVSMNDKIERFLPWVLTLSCLGPCMCCVKSHPDTVPVSFDLVSERVYSRSLVVVSVATFSFQVYLSFVVAFFMDPATFALCDGLNTTAVEETVYSGDWRNASARLRALDTSVGGLGDFAASFVDLLQSGVLALFFAMIIGLGNSRWHHRGWGFVAPIVAVVSWVGSSFGSLQYCWLQLRAQGWSAQFWLIAASASNSASSVLYLLQLVLLVRMLLLRGCNKREPSDGVWCTGAEHCEPSLSAASPVMPLPPGMGANLQSTLLVSQPSSQQREVSGGGVGVGSAHHERPSIPLRFWIATFLAGIAVGVLAAIQLANGVLYTHVVKAWADSTSAQIAAAKLPLVGFTNSTTINRAIVLLPKDCATFPAMCTLRTSLKGLETSVGFVISTLEVLEYGVQFVHENFWAIRPSIICGIIIGVLNEIYWKRVAFLALRAFGDLTASERADRIRASDSNFFYGVLFVPFVALNSLCSYLVVSLVSAVGLYTIFSPFLLEYLYWAAIDPTGPSNTEPHPDTKVAWNFRLFTVGLPAMAATFIARQLLFSGVVVNDTHIRYHRLFRFLDCVYSFTLGPVSATILVIIQFVGSLLYWASSLARIDRPLVEGAGSFEPGYMAWNGMLKCHWHADLVARG